MYYYYVASKSPGKLRKVSISDEEIEIVLPGRPYFIIKWAEIDKIDIKLNIIELKPYHVYHIHFIYQDSETTTAISLDDFHKEKLVEILRELKANALSMKKEFSAVKESIVSGVYLVEKLEIE